MALNFSFLKEESFDLRKQETFVGNTCEIYLPSYFFSKNDNNTLANDLGTRISTIGIFYFKVDGKLYHLELPVRFEFTFTSIEKKRMKIKSNFPEIEYYIYTLKNGDAFVYDILHKKDTGDLKFYINKLVEGAALPYDVPYEKALPIFLEAMKITEITNLNITSVSIEFLLSEIYRSKRNMQQPFRLEYNGHNSFDFKMVRLQKIPQLNSTFTGITGEDINTQLVSAIVKTRENVQDKETPIEKIIKY